VPCRSWRAPWDVDLFYMPGRYLVWVWVISPCGETMTENLQFAQLAGLFGWTPRIMFAEQLGPKTSTSPMAITAW